VIALDIDQGQSVKKGQALARLDAGRLEIELQQALADRAVAEADVAQKQIELEWRQRDLDNYRSLSAGGAGKARELYDAEMEVRVASAKLESSRRSVEAIGARMDLLKKRIGDMTIAAPFDGVIVSKLSEQGEWVAAGAAVAEMIATHAADAWLDVPQQFASAIMGRQPMVTVLIEATGERLETSDLRVIPQVDPRARTFALVARLDNASGALAPGMSVTAYVPTGAQAERLTISRDAIVRGPAGTMVYVARTTQPGAPASAMPADVRILFSAGERLVVESPMLQPGDLLVVEGNERLFPTAPIIPQPAGPTPKEDGQPAKP